MYVVITQPRSIIVRVLYLLRLNSIKWLWNLAHKKVCREITAYEESTNTITVDFSFPLKCGEYSLEVK